METKIKAIHFDVSEKLVAFINKKVEKLTRRFDAVTEVEVNGFNLSFHIKPPFLVLLGERVHN